VLIRSNEEASPAGRLTDVPSSIKVNVNELKRHPYNVSGPLELAILISLQFTEKMFADISLDV
jgi:hypothetical protein